MSPPILGCFFHGSLSGGECHHPESPTAVCAGVSCPLLSTETRVALVDRLLGREFATLALDPGAATVRLHHT